AFAAVVLASLTVFPLAAHRPGSMVSRRHDTGLHRVHGPVPEHAVRARVRVRRLHDPGPRWKEASRLAEERRAELRTLVESRPALVHLQPGLRRARPREPAQAAARARVRSLGA